MSCSEIIYHRVLALPVLYEISKRDSNFDSFIRFYSHTITDSKAGFGDPHDSRQELEPDKSSPLDFPPSPPPLRSNIYNRDGEGVIDMMRELFGPVAPKNCFNVHVEAVTLKIPDVTDIRKNKLGTGEEDKRGDTFWGEGSPFEIILTPLPPSLFAPPSPVNQLPFRHNDSRPHSQHNPSGHPDIP